MTGIQQAILSRIMSTHIQHGCALGFPWRCWHPFLVPSVSRLITNRACMKLPQTTSWSITIWSDTCDIYRDDLSQDSIRHLYVFMLDHITVWPCLEWGNKVKFVLRVLFSCKISPNKWPICHDSIITSWHHTTFHSNSISFVGHYIYRNEWIGIETGLVIGLIKVILMKNPQWASQLQWFTFTISDRPWSHPPFKDGALERSGGIVSKSKFTHGIESLYFYVTAHTGKAEQS